MMPLSFQPISNGNKWAGHDWRIDDEDLLAEMVAKVALGQYRHVVRVLDQTDCMEASTAATAFDGARQLLTVAGADPFHRDGWVFQVISWIAAQMLKNGELIAPPHMQHADKGFDGLHVELSTKKDAVSFAVVCEDKATQNPRKMVRDKVWPEFVSMENGDRDHELISRVTSLLETQSDVDPDQAVEKIFWDTARAYRVAVTIGALHNSKNGRRGLFKNYKTNVSGQRLRRRTATLYFDDLRGWMGMFAAKVIAVLDRMEAENV